MLKRSRKRNFDIEEIETEPVIVKTMQWRMRPIRKIAIDQPRRAMPIRRNRGQRQPRLGIARANNYRHLILDYPALLSGNRRDRVPEILHMIESDRRDHAQNRRDHVGRIEPSPESGFDYRDIDTSIGEIRKHHRNRELEERRR